MPEKSCFVGMIKRHRSLLPIFNNLIAECRVGPLLLQPIQGPKSRNLLWFLAVSQNLILPRIGEFWYLDVNPCGNRTEVNEP